MPPTIEKAFELTGIQNVIVEPLRASVSWKYYQLDKWFRNCLMAITQGAISDLAARAAMGVEWSPTDGALNYLKMCMNVSANVDLSQITDCGENCTEPCSCVPLDCSEMFPQINDKIGFDITVFVQRDGVVLPNCSALYGPDIEKKEGLKKPEPEDVMVFLVPDGECIERPLFSEMGIEIRIKVCDDATTTGGSNVTLSYWPENPSEGGKSPGFYGSEGIYFGIDVEGDVTLPIEMILDLPDIPSSLSGADASAIAQAVKIVSWDDAIDNWKEEDFDMTYNSTSQQITIKIDHLSVFAVGFDEQALLMIPGYSAFIMVVASLGAVAVIIKRTKKR
jgi:hypothetical protein